MLKIVNEYAHTHRHTHAHAYKLWSFDKTRKHSLGRSLVAFCGFCCCCCNLKPTKGKPKQAHGEKRWVLTYLWFLCGLLWVCLCLLCVYVCVCVCVGLPHQHHHHQLVQTLDFPPFVFALPFAGANSLDCLGIGIGISLVLLLFSSLCVCYALSSFSVFLFRQNTSLLFPSLALFSVASWQWFLTFHARLFRAIFFYFSSLFFPFLFSAWG